MSRTKTAMREHLRTPTPGTTAERETQDHIRALRLISLSAAEARASLEESAASLRATLRGLRALVRQRS